MEAKQPELPCSACTFDNCQEIKCPCNCGGVLMSDGRNIHNNHTFLECNKCKCSYIAKDK